MGGVGWDGGGEEGWGRGYWVGCGGVVGCVGARGVVWGGMGVGVRRVGVEGVGWDAVGWSGVWGIGFPLESQA